MRRLLPFVVIACSSPPATPMVDPSKSTVTASKTSGIKPNEAVQLSVVVRDQLGEPFANAAVNGTVAADAGNVHSGASSNMLGEASLSVSFASAGRKTVTVTAEQVKLKDLDFDVVAGPAVGFEFVTQPMTVKAGATLPPVKLRIVDAQGNTSGDPYSASLRLVRSTSGATLTGGAQKMTTDGGITFDMLSLNRPQPGYALRAESPTGAALESNLFDVIAGDPDMGMTTLSAMPASLPTSAMSTLTLTVRDVAGNALSSQNVTLVVTGSGNTLGAMSGITGGNGVFTTTLSSSVAQTKTVTATIGSITASTMVTFTP